jgi:hypothetical protein
LISILIISGTALEIAMLYNLTEYGKKSNLGNFSNPFLSFGKLADRRFDIKNRFSTHRDQNLVDQNFIYV